MCFSPANDKQRFNLLPARSSAPQSNHNTITSAIENTAREVGLRVRFFQYSLQIVNLDNDVTQNVVIIYTDSLDSLRGSLRQELYKTEKFNKGTPQRNYRAQTRPNKVTFTLAPSLRLIPGTRVPSRPTSVRYN